MKTISLILAVVYFIGCSQSSLFLKKQGRTHIAKNQSTTSIAEKQQTNTQKKHIGVPFTSTFSSFSPVMDSKSNVDMFWDQVLNYVFFIISFIIIALLIFAGIKNKAMLKEKILAVSKHKAVS